MRALPTAGCHASAFSDYQLFLVIPANAINVREFNRLKAEGTDFDGESDCCNTNFDLEPVSIE